MRAHHLPEEAAPAKCRTDGCPGQYERRYIVHTVKHGGDVIVIEDVPAEVCDVCGDTLLEPQTVRRLEEILRRSSGPHRQAPVYAFPK